MINRKRLVFWLNSPSPHQRPFLKRLNQEDDYVLQVYYFGEIDKVRQSQGWSNTSLEDFEQYLHNINIELFLSDPDIIHMVPGISNPISAKIIKLLISKNRKWIHWSERYGGSIAKKVYFNSFLFLLISNFYFLKMRTYGQKVNKYAVGAFAIGNLAFYDFKKIGIDTNKIKPLFYSVNPLIPTCKIDSIQNFKENSRIFLCTSQICERKGIKELLYAFAKLKFSGWKMIIIGKKDEKEYFQQLSSKLRIDKRVLFTGTIPIEQVANYMQYADVFVLPTKFDGWGVALNEAASMGLPLISTTQCGAAFHAIEENKNGYIVKAGNVNELAMAMQKYINDESLIKIHGDKSMEIYKTNLSIESNIIRLKQAIQNWTNK